MNPHRPASLTCEACQLIFFLAGKGGSTLEVVFFLFYSNFQALELKRSSPFFSKLRPTSKPDLDQYNEVFDVPFTIDDIFLYVIYQHFCHSEVVDNN